MMPMKTLGILATTDRHAAWVLPLARSARRKAVRVRVHLTGSAVRIAATATFEELMRVATVTICRRSAESLLAPAQRARCSPHLFVGPDHTARLIAGCDRHVVF